MKNINNELDKILSEDLGEDVRYPIHDSIKALLDGLMQEVVDRKAGDRSVDSVIDAVNDNYLSLFLKYNDVQQLLETIQIHDDSTAHYTAQDLIDAISSISISVKNYGAHGDGIIDDSEAVQNAMNAASLLGKPLYFPAGTYYCKTTIKLGLVDDEKYKYPPIIYGDGVTTVLELTFDTGGWMRYQKASEYNKDYEKIYGAVGSDVYEGIITKGHVLSLDYLDPDSGRQEEATYLPTVRIASVTAEAGTIDNQSTDIFVRSQYASDDAYNEAIEARTSELWNAGYAVGKKLSPDPKEGPVEVTTLYRNTHVTIKNRMEELDDQNNSSKVIYVYHDGVAYKNDSAGLNEYYNNGYVYGNSYAPKVNTRPEYMVFANFKMTHGYENGHEYGSPDGIRGRFMFCAFVNVYFREFRSGSAINTACYTNGPVFNANNLKWTAGQDTGTYCNLFNNVYMSFCNCGVCAGNAFNGNNFYRWQVQYSRYGLFSNDNNRSLAIIGGDFEAISKSCIVFSKVSGAVINGLYVEIFNRFITVTGQVSAEKAISIDVDGCYFMAQKGAAMGEDFDLFEHGWMVCIDRSAGTKGRWYKGQLVIKDDTVTDVREEKESAVAPPYQSEDEKDRSITYNPPIFYNKAAAIEYFNNAGISIRDDYKYDDDGDQQDESGGKYLWVATDDGYRSVPGRVMIKNSKIELNASLKDHKLFKAPKTYRSATLFVGVENNSFDLLHDNVDKIITFYDLIDTTNEFPSDFVVNDAVDSTWGRFGVHPLISDIPLYNFATVGDGSAEYNPTGLPHTFYKIDNNVLKDKTVYTVTENSLLVEVKSNANSLTGIGNMLNYTGGIVFGNGGYLRTFKNLYDADEEKRGIAENNRTFKCITVGEGANKHLEIGTKFYSVSAQGGELVFTHNANDYAVPGENAKMFNSLEAAQKPSSGVVADDTVFITPLYETYLDDDGFPNLGYYSNNGGMVRIYLPTEMTIPNFDKRNEGVGTCVVYYLNEPGSLLNTTPHFCNCILTQNTISIYGVSTTNRIGKVYINMTAGMVSRDVIDDDDNWNITNEQEENANEN